MTREQALTASRHADRTPLRVAIGDRRDGVRFLLWDTEAVFRIEGKTRTLVVMAEPSEVAELDALELWRPVCECGHE